jgi:hypothetical protein
MRFLQTAILSGCGLWDNWLRNWFEQGIYGFEELL